MFTGLMYALLQPLQEIPRWKWMTGKIIRPGDVIPVSVANDSTLLFEYAADNPQPIPVKVDAANVTSVAKQVYVEYGGDTYCESVKGPENFVTPCESVLSINLKHSVESGSSHPLIIRLMKI